MALQSAAIALIISPQTGKIILTKRKDVPIWVLPGGGIENGETPEAALIREVKEETGLQVKIIRKTGEYHPINRLTSPTHVYFCHPIDGVLETSEESSEVSFFDTKELPKSLFRLHREWIEDAFSSQECLYKKITQVTYLNVFCYFIKHPLITLRYLTTRFKV